MPKINPTISNMTIPGTRYFSNRASQFNDAINLTLGVPDFDTDITIKSAAKLSIDQESLNYSHNAGLLSLRQAISHYYQNNYEVTYDPDNEILVTVGGSQAIDSTLRAILEPGDEVIIPEPAYPAYRSIVQMVGGHPIPIDTSGNQFVLEPDLLEASITDKTKAVILNYPTNPTGVSLNQDEIHNLVDIIKRNDIFLISDEIYAQNSLDHRHYSFAEFSEIKNKTIIINGLSKSHSMTGWRIGFLVTSKELLEAIIIPHLYNAICASIPSQHAAIEALTNGIEIPEKMNAAYRERRAYLIKEFNKLGLNFVEPTGAFYIFPSIEKFEANSFTFAEKLLDDQHVAVVPGSAFGEAGEGYIRISFATSMENLKEGMKRLRHFIEKY